MYVSALAAPAQPNIAHPGTTTIPAPRMAALSLTQGAITASTFILKPIMALPTVGALGGALITIEAGTILSSSVIHQVREILAARVNPRSLVSR